MYSILMTDKDKRREGYIEATMDYILAWTFKMCDKTNHKTYVNETLLLECRKVLSKLIGLDSLTDECDIRTYMEWERIDLIVEVRLQNGDFHAVLIENKVEAKLPNEELQKNKKTFTHHYNNDIRCIQHYWLICADSPVSDEMKRQCEINGFQYITLDELSDYTAPDVGNAIFDEFWRREW